MQEIITINGEKYVKYIEPEKKEYKRWRAKYTESYFSTSFYWKPIRYTANDTDMDEYLYSEWRYYETEQEAIKERDKRLAIVRVNDAILYLNEWWKPDWKDDYEEKYSIIYEYQYNSFSIANNSYTKRDLSISYMKSEEIADKIIKEHQEDLKLIFDI